MQSFQPTLGFIKKQSNVQ